MTSSFFFLFTYWSKEDYDSVNDIDIVTRHCAKHFQRSSWVGNIMDGSMVERVPVFIIILSIELFLKCNSLFMDMCP